MKIRTGNRRAAKRQEFEQLRARYEAVYPMGSFAPTGQWKLMKTRPMPAAYLDRMVTIIRRNSRRCFCVVRP